MIMLIGGLLSVFRVLDYFDARHGQTVGPESVQEEVLPDAGKPAAEGDRDEQPKQEVPDSSFEPRTRLQESEVLMLTVPGVSSGTVGEVTVSLAFEEYGSTRRYKLAELTASVVGQTELTHLSQGKSIQLQGNQGNYSVTVLGLNEVEQTASVRIQRDPQGED